MKALIFGSNSFICSHLVDELLVSGYSVRVFDRPPVNFCPPIGSVEYCTGQFGDAISMSNALKGVDVVYHINSATVPGTSNLDPVADIRDNLISTVVLLDQMIKMGIYKIIYLSSGGTVYGKPQQLPIPEHHHLNPLCSYGIVKVAIENYLYMYQELYGLRPIILRESNIYGPRQGHTGVHGVISTFLAKMMSGESLTVWGDGSIIRDYLYVTDLTKLCVLAAKINCIGVYNAGYGKGFSVTAIIDLISDVTGLQPTIIYQPGRSFDIQEVVLDINKSKSIFGWTPVTDIREGIVSSWQWICDEGTGELQTLLKR